MSRGCGNIQRMAISLIADAGDGASFTYAEIVGRLLQALGVNDPDARLNPSRERSLRRALKGLCDRDLLSTLGTGRPGDPYRYVLARVCKLCGKEIGDGEPQLSFADYSICARCAGSVATAYFEVLLPEMVERKEKANPDPIAAAEKPTGGDL
jgi:hypothetical protein